LDLEALEKYGMRRIASVRISENTFIIEVIDDETSLQEGCIYAFTIDDEIVRVGSSAGPLRRRLSAWMRDVSRSLRGEKSATPLDEGERWRKELSDGHIGAIYARRGTLIATPIGEFTSHLDEERILITRHKPRLNRSWR